MNDNHIYMHNSKMHTEVCFIFRDMAVTLRGDVTKRFKMKETKRVSVINILLNNPCIEYVYCVSMYV